ncbi:hypothetical protein BJ912DRAFT_923942 [Pholiota molesta]|nr:hypothetical protein BJ912DRAFT_923942 [Pholiota molesta]
MSSTMVDFEFHALRANTTHYGAPTERRRRMNNDGAQRTARTTMAHNARRNDDTSQPRAAGGPDTRTRVGRNRRGGRGDGTSSPSPPKEQANAVVHHGRPRSMDDGRHADSPPECPSQGTGMARASEQGSMTSAPVAFASTLAEAEHRRARTTPPVCHPPPPTTARGPYTATPGHLARRLRARRQMHGAFSCVRACMGAIWRILGVCGAPREVLFAQDGCLTVCVYEEHCQCSVLRHEDATWQLGLQTRRIPVTRTRSQRTRATSTRGSTGMDTPLAHSVVKWDSNSAGEVPSTPVKVVYKAVSRGRD